MGVFARILEFAKGSGETGEVMIDATRLKAHRTAASLVRRGLSRGHLDGARGA